MNDIRVRLPRKLNKNVNSGELTEAGRLHPVGAVGITLNMLPIHRVSMTLAENDLPLAMHDLVEVYNHKGSVGVYRVIRITNTYRKHRKIELSHGLDVFSDSHFSVIEEYSGTVAEYLQKVINAQTQTIAGTKYWQLGTCEDSNLWNKSIKYDNLMECLTELAGTEEEYVFTFDMSSFPWTLNFVARNDDILSEFRLGRNAESCAVVLDDSDMCTRLYLSVTSETNDDAGHGTYIEEGYYVFNNTASQDEYGIICKTAGVNRNDFASQEDLESWVDDYFERHSTPGVQITIDGIELSQLTGENVDETHLERICRVALPDYDTTFNERIVSVCYPDALRLPFAIQASLANKKQTSEAAFAEIKKTSSSASGAARSAGILAHNEATYLRRAISDTANGLYSRIELTASYIRSEVADMYEGLYSRIEQTACYIRSEVADVYDGLYSRIEQTASSIRSEVSNTASSLRSSIQQQAGRIDLVVDGSGSSASIKISAIVNGINESQAQINADRVIIGSGTSGKSVKVYVDGEIDATEAAIEDLETRYFKTGTAKATLINTGSIVADIVSGGSVSGSSVYVGDGSSGGSGSLYYRGSAFSRQSVTLGSAGSYIAEGWYLGNNSGNNLSLNHYHKITATAGTGTDAGKIIIKLQQAVSENSSDAITNFNIADTAFYKSHAYWYSNVGKAGTPSQVEETWIASAPITVYALDSTKIEDAVSHSIDVTDTYEAGYAAGEAAGGSYDQGWEDALNAIEVYDYYKDYLVIRAHPTPDSSEYRTLAYVKPVYYNNWAIERSTPDTSHNRISVDIGLSYSTGSGYTKSKSNAKISHDFLK